MTIPFSPHSAPMTPEQLYRQYSTLVFLAARRVLGNDRDAEDAAQEAWIRVLQNFSKIRSLERNKVGAYLVVMSRNTAIDLLRRTKETLPLAEELQQTGSPDLEAQTLQRLDLDAALETLAAGDRLLLERKYILGHTEQELADGLGVNKSTVSRRLAALRLQMANRMGEEETRHEHA